MYYSNAAYQNMRKSSHQEALLKDYLYEGLLSEPFDLFELCALTDPYPCPQSS